MSIVSLLVRDGLIRVYTCCDMILLSKIIHPIQMSGKTPLHVAAKKNYFYIVELLISSGAEVNARTNVSNDSIVIPG